jgi:PAS domain S-box-containing protein
LLYRFAWGAPGIEARLDYPLLQGGLSLSEAGLGRLEAELRSGRAIAALVRQLPEVERTLPARAGSKAFATVPIFAAGQWWGLLAFSETRYEREWSAPEVEALKAAAAVLGAAIDREQADDALRESEERFERLSAATFEGIGITDAGAFVDGNEQLAAMLASPLADLVGRPVSDFVAPEDIDLVRAQIAAGSEGPYQHMALRADGSRFPVEVRARSLPHRGRTLRVTALRDISARVLAEERQRRLEADLRQAAEQWRQTFDALDLGLVLADPDGRIVRLNRGALDLATTSSFAEAAGRTLDRLSDQEPWRTVRDLHRRVGESRASVTAEALEAGSGRSFYILANPWFRAQGEPPWRLITFRDVTDFVRMQDQLRHARTMQAMGSLVAGVAHEVRNPLFSISAAVDALEAEMGQRPEFAEYAALLRSQVGRLSQLMRDLLDFGKPAVLRRSPTSLADLWRRAGRACAALARERKVRVEEHLAPELPPVDVDAARVEQAFENLLANAVQHAPAGSAVRVRADIDPDLPEPTLRCTVEDDGPGLPAGCETQIFEPFFTRRKGGTGLGLSIVQRVVEAHGGRVSAENREGGGARFRVLIPVDAPRKGDGGA